MTTILRSKWVRSDKGWIAGVCQGLGESFDISPMVIRVLWFLSIFFFGIGFVAYFIAAFSFPVQGREHKAHEPKVLGVCLRLSEKLELDIGLVRFLAILILLSSFGTTILAYLILHFLVPNNGSTFTSKEGL